MPNNPSLHDSKIFAEALASFGAGISAQITGDYALALTNYLHAVSLDPSNEELYMRAAVVYLQQNDSSNAVALIKYLCDIKPDSPQAFIWYGVMCNAADRRSESYAAFRRAIQLDPVNPDSYKELAANYVRDDELERAILILERGALQSSDPTGLLFFLGQLYLHKADTCKDPKTALEYRDIARNTLERARQISPDHWGLLEQLGDLYIVDRYYEEAATVLQRLVELQPDNLPLKKKLALVYGALDQQEKAAALLEDISQKIAFHPKAYYFLGELYEKMGEREKAILNFRLATQMDPPDPAPFLHLALLNLEQNPEEAIGYLHDGLLKMPDDPRLTEILAYLYLKQGNYEQAVRHFGKTERALRAASPGIITPAFLYSYVTAAHHHDDYTTVARLLQELMTADPLMLDYYVQDVLKTDDPKGIIVAQKSLALLTGALPDHRTSLLFNLALLFIQQNEYEKAVQLFARAEPEAREHQTEDRLGDTFYFWYGAAEERLGHADRSTALLEKCLTINPANLAARNYLAYMWAEQGIRLKEAEEHISIALKTEPDNGAFIDTYGWVLYMRGRYEEAGKQLAKAASLEPDDPAINEHYGDVLDKLNRRADAITYWKKALEKDPDNTRLQALINQAEAQPAAPEPAPAAGE